MKTNKFLAIAIVTIAFATNASAQETVTASISASVNAAVSGIPTLTAFTTQGQLENGVISSPVSFLVKSNRLWNVSSSITAINATALASGLGPQTISAPLTPANIAWATANGATDAGTFATFAATTSTTSAALVIKSGAMGDASISGNTFNLQYKVTPGYLVDPGTYAVSVTHTISAQ